MSVRSTLLRGNIVLFITKNYKYLSFIPIIMEKKKALITGITGQDGSYLTEFLLEKGYEVHGIVRRSSTINRERIDHLIEPDHYTGKERGKIVLHYGDLLDPSSIEKIMKIVKPDEIYNLGAQSHVRISFDIPENTTNIVALGALRLLEAIKNICPQTRFYQASSSEMFGNALEIPQTENTPFHPRSPYACAKVFAFHITKNYRESYNLHASNGILYNHESQRRGESFVTRKITLSLARLKLGLINDFSLGNLYAERDWGYAEDYVRAMWLMLQQETPDDYIIGTGEKHSVREFLEEAARCLGLNIKSNGKNGIEEEYLDDKGNIVVKIHPRYFRPSEVDILHANPEKARIKLNWQPQIKFKDLVRIMCQHDLKIAEKEFYLKNKGKRDEVSEKMVALIHPLIEIAEKSNIQIQKMT